jgi:Septum formation initiator
VSEERKSKVQRLDNDYTKEQYAKYTQQHRQIIFRRRRLLVLFVIAFFVFASMGISLFNDYLHLRQLDEVKAETVVKEKAVNQKVADLTREVGLLKDDDYVAKVARSRFLYSKEGELIFPLPGNEAAVAEDSSEATDSSETTHTSR